MRKLKRCSMSPAQVGSEMPGSRSAETCGCLPPRSSGVATPFISSSTRNVYSCSNIAPFTLVIDGDDTDGGNWMPRMSMMRLSTQREPGRVIPGLLAIHHLRPYRFRAPADFVLNFRRFVE
jgi:hypothetical protein